MKASDFLLEQLEALELLSGSMTARSLTTRPLLEVTASLVMPDVELNDSQQETLGRWIYDIGNLGANRELEYPQLRAMQLATYINSCYRPK